MYWKFQKYFGYITLLETLLDTKVTTTFFLVMRELWLNYGLRIKKKQKPV